MARQPADREFVLELSSPLRDLTRVCATVCQVDCCGTDAFDIDAKPIASWVGGYGSGPLWTALDQLGDLIRAVAARTGQIRSNGWDFNHIWSSPSEAITYLGVWRREVVRAVEAVRGRALTLDPAWRTEAVVGLARGIPADRAFDRLPILADALEDVGCDHPDILGHLRDDSPHARGCWVVDLILGKG